MGTLQGGVSLPVGDRAIKEGERGSGLPAPPRESIVGWDHGSQTDEPEKGGQPSKEWGHPRDGHLKIVDKKFHLCRASRGKKVEQGEQQGKTH